LYEVKKVRKQIVTNETIERVKNGKVPGDVLLNTFKLLFGWDGESDIKPWNYQISLELAKELITAEAELAGCSFGAAALFWMNKGPSFKDDLERNEVRTEVK